MNILVFMTDDHGQWASGCYGNQEVQTPTMDFLADTGARMTNAFTPSPVCSPARACFFTGRLPSQHGIHDWIKEEDRTLPWMEREKPLAADLREGGYHTGLVGKWHCGRSDLPHAGFDTTFSHVTHQFPHCGKFRFLENGQAVAFSGQQTAMITSKAQQFLRERDHSRPFFLFVGYVDTHAPFTEHPERLVRRYRNASFVDIPQETYHGPGRIVFSLSQDETRRREELAQYYAAVTYIDEQIGILLDELEGTDDLDDTLVVYTSDHGHMNGHHGLSTKGNATVPQNFLEESIRVPCLLRWPDHIQAQHTHGLLVDHCDLFQTVLDAAGCQESEEAAQRRHSPGRSYLPPLLGAEPQTPWRTEQFCEYGNARMIRTDRYKLIVRYPPHSERFSDELYDLQADPRENVNVIANSDKTEITQQLRAHLNAYFDRYEEPERSGRDILARPIHNPNEPWRAAVT